MRRKKCLKTYWWRCRKTGNSETGEAIKWGTGKEERKE
jgi:hypothetical protein